MELTLICHGVISGIFGLKEAFIQKPSDVNTQQTNGNFYTEI